MTTIKSSNMRKSYQSEGIFVYALFDCNIVIKEGEFVVIHGGKASGKSTLLHLLGGYERPSGGEIYYNNDNLTLCDEDELTILRRKEVGFLFHNDTLIPELNVHENIIMPSILTGNKVDEDYYKELIKSLRLTEVLNRKPKQLTNSQKRCVTIARALIHKPNIILMDEPLDELYPQIDKIALDYLLNAVYQCNRILIMVTNNQDIKAYANHMIKLRNGVVVEDKLI